MKKTTLLTVVSVGLIAALVGIWSGSKLLSAGADAHLSRYQALTVFTEPRKLAEFELIDQHAAGYDAARLENNWTLVFFGFTSCGHVCPMTMAKLKAIADAVNGNVNVVFVSVDPGRDSPQKIADYVNGFDPGFTGVTGTAAQIDRFASMMGVPYYVDPDPDNYTVDHSGAIFVVNEDAALAASVSPPHDVEKIVADLNVLMGSG